ncbi:MAG: hypothetical protein D6731_13945 [Planctomycetota bacterium]|nr:MAG: hypothetical protein D6731_13945 [Planctomycetota bacterium]
MTCVLRAALCVLAACCVAEAQPSQIWWDDPTLGEAARAAGLVVLARAERVAENGVAYRVERTLHGPSRDGDLLAVTGLHHPRLRARPPVSVGDRAYLLLWGEPRGEGFRLPTPTFGRFVRRDGHAVLSFGGPDTFVRLAVEAARAEAILRACATGRADTGLLRWCREVLGASDATNEQVYLSLCVLAEVGEPSDAAVAGRVLRDPSRRGPEQERVLMAAARVLGRCGGGRAARLLVGAAAQSGRRAVASVAIAEALHALGDDPPARAAAALGRELARLAPRLDPRPVRYGAADDPRRNFVDSPFLACMKALGRLRATAGVPLALRALEGEDFEAIRAGLAYFELLGDVERAEEIAQRMRPRGHRDAFVNHAFGRTLRALTGAERPDEREAWLAWCRERRDEAAGPRRPGGSR